MPSFDHPAWLPALLLALLPLRWHGQSRSAWASLGSLPEDGASRLLGLMLRLLAAAAIAACALSLAGAYRQGEPIERTGTGAHVEIVLDRSSSMADGFAGSRREAGEESKAQAAARLLDRFVTERPLDLFGLVVFSTAPLHVLSLSADHGAVRAAIEASASPGTGLTNIAAGLSMALDAFRERPRTGSRVLLLVSDGAASVDGRAQMLLRRAFQETSAQLYWVYLRTPTGQSPTQPPPAGSAGGVAPEYYLDQFFRDLGSPYRLYEADNPQALERAIDDVARLENLPMRYLEPQPRQSLTAGFDALALAATLLLLLARVLEVPQWR